MITHQPVNNHGDVHAVTDNMLREVGLAIEGCGGKVTFAGLEPVRKTVMKAVLHPRSSSLLTLWPKRQSGENALAKDNTFMSICERLDRAKPVAT